MSASRPEQVSILEVSGAATDTEGRARFDEWAQVFDTVPLADTGTSDAWSADELRAALDNPHKFYIDLAAITGDGTIVGAAEMILNRRDNTHLVILNIAVLPEHRRSGIGRLLLDEVERRTREHGRRTIITETVWSGEDGAADSSGGFARRLGWEDVQTMRRSDFPVDAPLPQVDLAETYAVETHVGTPPEADAQDRAHLLRRMSTDAPLGGLDMEEQDWDAERVIATDARIASMKRGRVIAFARHLASGQLVGFTEIQIPGGLTAQDEAISTATLAYQNDTLVLSEHRGHGLGLALKAAAAEVLRDAYPSVVSVRTWNALENSHMLAVNDALGYQTSGFEREWQKRL